MKTQHAVIILMISLVIASRLLLFFAPLTALIVSTVTFITLLGLAVWQKKSPAIMVILAIIPATTLIEYSLSLDGIWRLISVYSSLLVLSVVFKLLLPSNEALEKYVTNISKRHIVFAASVGALIGAAALFIYDSTPLNSLPLIVALLLAILFGLGEEVFLRGLLQHHTAQILSPKGAAVVAILAGVLLSVGIFDVWLIGLAVVSHTTFSLLYYAIPSLPLTMLANTSMKVIAIVSMHFFSI